MMKRTWTRPLLIATVLVSGFAGELVDRALIASPAWNALGSTAWAEFSQHADLGTGLIIYPIYGAGLLLLAVATAVSYRLDRNAPPQAGLPIYLTAAGAISVMALTARAAPIMLGIPGIHNDIELQHAFEQFTLWGVYLRGAFGILTFAASVWALARYALRPAHPG